MRGETLNDKKINGKKIVFVSFTAIVILALTAQVCSADTMTDWYENNKDILENNGIAAMVLRYISWIITSLLVSFANACETLYDTAFGFIDYTNDPKISEWIESFRPVMIALMALSLLWLGIIMILHHEKKPKIVINVLIAVVVITSSSLIFTQLNEWSGALKDGVKESYSANKIAYSTVNNNIADLVYLNDKHNGLEKVNWSKDKEYGSKITGKKSFEQINYTEVLNYESEMYDWKGDTSDLLQHQLVIGYINGQKVKSTRENYNGFGWNSDDDTDILNEFYYRYTLSSLTTWLQLVALIVIFLTMSYKCLRIAFELIVARLFAYLLAAEISGGEKIRRTLIFIRDSYILLCTTVICIKVYDLMTSMVADYDGIIKGIFSLFIAFSVIDGPNLVEKLLGMDAGLKSSTARMLAIGRIAMGAAKAPGGAMKKGKGIRDGSLERGGILGAATGAIWGKRNEDGSRSGGFMNKIKGKGNESDISGGKAGGAAGGAGNDKDNQRGSQGAQQGKNNDNSASEAGKDNKKPHEDAKSPDFMNDKNGNDTLGSGDDRSRAGGDSDTDTSFMDKGQDNRESYSGSDRSNEQDKNRDRDRRNDSSSGKDRESKRDDRDFMREKKTRQNRSSFTDRRPKKNNSKFFDE